MQKGLIVARLKIEPVLKHWIPYTGEACADKTAQSLSKGDKEKLSEILYALRS